MFAASAIHTNAGIAGRLGEPPRTIQDIRRVQLMEQENARLRRAAALLGAEGAIEHPTCSTESERIMSSIAEAHGLTVQMLKGRSRVQRICAARQHAIYEVHRQCPSLSTHVIGRLFGKRDHTTIIHAIRAWPAKASARGIPCEPINLPVVKGYTPEAAHG